MTRTLENLQMDGGCLVFNFINTVNTRKPASEFDYLETFGDFVAWSAKAGALDWAKAKALEAYAVQHPEVAATGLHNALETREVLYALFAAIAAGRLPDDAVAAAFNRKLSEAFQSIQFKFGPAGAEMQLGGDELSSNDPLFAVLKSAMEVLTREDFKRIRECPRCGWLFLDTSKSGKRKWCDMNVCGSREKSLGYYYRKTRQNA